MKYFIFVIVLVQFVIIGLRINDLEEQVANLNVLAIAKIENSLPSRENLDNAWVGAYFGEGRIVCKPNVFYCQHEVGHALDDFLGFPSQSKEFQMAAELFIEQCRAGTIEDFYCTIKDWAGVGGNPMTEVVLDNGDVFEWGGYGELYAVIFETSHTFLTPITPSLHMFFIIGWESND